MKGSMKGAVLPGNSTVALKEYPIPEPGHGQVLVRNEIFNHLRERHPGDLPRASRQGPGRLPGSHRGA